MCVSGSSIGIVKAVGCDFDSVEKNVNKYKLCSGGTKHGSDDEKIDECEAGC